MCEKSVLDPIPRIQHRLICVTVNPGIVPQPTISRRRFNPKNWHGFLTEFDADIEEVKSIPENYGMFIELLRVVSRRNMYLTAYLVSQINPRASMKHTKDIIQATPFAKVQWRLEQSCSTLTHNSHKA